MAFIAVSGEPGCRHEELARLAAQRLQCELVSESNLRKMMAAQFGESSRMPERAWRPLATSVLASVGLDHRHLVLCCADAELLVRDLPGVFRFHVVAPESVRLDNLVADCRLSRTEAKLRLRKMASEKFQIRKRRFGQKTSPTTSFDVVVNAQAMGAAEMVDVLVAAVRSQ